MNSEPFQAPTLEELAPLFPNYSIDAFIAQGGMGAIYLATQTSLERQVAIKILPREFEQDAEFRASFAAEAKAMAKLNHPNLIGVIDFGEADNMPFIVMEYVAGKSLHDSSYGKQIDPMEAARIVLETCRGLHHAHEHNILHRDVKPANILMDPHHAVPKIGDFGLTMAASEEHDDGLIYGTPGYAAPEVYEGKADARSDVYAAAVILYQLLTGQMPETPYQHPSTLSKCGRQFDALLAKALQPEAHARFQSAEELANELETIQKKPAAAVTVAANPAFTTAQPQKQLASAKKGNGGLFIGIGIAFAFVAVGAGLFLLTSKKKDEPIVESNQGKIVTPPPRPETSSPLVPAEKEKPNSEIKLSEEEPESGIAQVEETKQDDDRREETSKRKRKRNRDRKNSTSKTETATTPEKVAPLSTFDYLDFLKRGRSYCAEKAAPALAQYQEELLKDIDNSDSKEIAPGLKKALMPLATIYVAGVRKQVDKLKAENNPYDANLLEQEANQAEESLPYFLKIVQGKNPLPWDIVLTTLEELIVGRWQPEKKRTAFIFSADGTIKCEAPSKNGSWTVEGNRVIVDWGKYRDRIEMVVGDRNRFVADYRGSGTRLVTFIREVQQPSFVEEEKEEKEDKITPDEFLIGDWLRDGIGRSALFSFLSDGKMNEDGRKSRGQWSSDGGKHYTVKLNSGTILKLEKKDADTLEINGGQFQLIRQERKDPLIGQWRISSGQNTDIVFTFDNDHNADNGDWDSKGKWARTEEGYLITWNSGKELTLSFLSFNEILVRNPNDHTYQITRE